jgi:hypothetical protein
VLRECAVGGDVQGGHSTSRNNARHITRERVGIGALERSTRMFG